MNKKQNLLRTTLGSVFMESDLMGGLVGENRLITISGKVNNPGIYEIPENATLKDILDIAGGMKNGKDFKAAQFGLPFGGFATKESLNEIVDFDHFFDSKH
ncbi:MAG: SLBB domain-containing protein, partial [Cetobacterium sp.]